MKPSKFVLGLYHDTQMDDGPQDDDAPQNDGLWERVNDSFEDDDFQESDDGSSIVSELSVQIEKWKLQQENIDLKVTFLKQNILYMGQRGRKIMYSNLVVHSIFWLPTE